MSDDVPTSRSRKAPSERFSGPARIVSLSRVLEELESEERPARNGHRQMAVVRGASLTQLVFLFEADGHLAEHSAPGLVTIHVIRGSLEVEAADKTHHLGAGEILVLDAGLPHSVRASEPSAMLLSVSLETKS